MPTRPRPGACPRVVISLPIASASRDGHRALVYGNLSDDVSLHPTPAHASTSVYGPTGIIVAYAYRGMFDSS